MHWIPSRGIWGNFLLVLEKPTELRSLKQVLKSKEMRRTSRNDEIELCIGQSGLKDFSSALNFLLRVGKDLSVEVEEDAMTLRSLNEAKSAFASITLPESYFDTYIMDLVPPKRAMSFHLALRPVCAVMKNFKKVTSLIIRTDPSVRPDKGDDLQVSHFLFPCHPIRSPPPFFFPF